MSLKVLLIIILVVLAIVAAIISVVFIFIKRSERAKCYRAAAHILHEEYLRASLMNSQLQECDMSKIYAVRMMVYVKNISSKPKKGYVFDVGDNVLFGRKESCNVIMNEVIVSGEHCVIFMQNDVVYLTDMSANGTILKRGLHSIKLNSCTCEVFSGDVIIVGRTSFKLVFFKFDGRLV